MAQKHDFGYQIAEEMGRIYGPAEAHRLKALADEIAARDAMDLPDDPATWRPPPRDPAQARVYRDRLVEGFRVGGYWQRQNVEKSRTPSTPGGPPPTPGPLTTSTLEREQQKRVDTWNRDFLDRQAKRYSGGSGRTP